MATQPRVSAAINEAASCYVSKAARPIIPSVVAVVAREHHVGQILRRATLRQLIEKRIVSARRLPVVGRLKSARLDTCARSAATPHA
jgi:hypothetical protein